MNLNFKRNRRLQGGLPQMSAVLDGWEIPITLMKITQSIVDGDKVETQSLIQFRGVIQPLSAEQLQLKDEAFRSWEWLQIHAKTSTLNLQTNDKIVYNNVRYKVMSIKNYDIYGFIVYDIVRDYQ